MNPSELLDILENLIARLKARRQKSVSAPAEIRNIESVVGTWYSRYKNPFTQMLGDERQIAEMDSRMDRLYNLASRRCTRRAVVRAAMATALYMRDVLLVPLSRSYWARTPERSPAGRDEAAATRLRKLDPLLADGYEQAVADIEDAKRTSYRGAAAELREVLTGVLHRLAPNEAVEGMDWYKESRRSGTRKETVPTRAERAKYILRSRMKGSAVTGSAEAHMVSVEGRLGDVVDATYKRGSAATHLGGERDELQSLLPYINALLRELLPPL
ncbi:MAG: pPIWI-associating nuclease domain-containing protein [Candidatus Acidiferrales bacterium]